MVEANETDVIAWGRDLERRHAWVLHKEKLAAGPVERFYTGDETDRYVSTVDGSPVAAAVLVLGTGHAMLAKPHDFVEIGSEEASVYIATLDKLRAAIAEAVTEAAATLRGRDAIGVGMVIIASALRAQLFALEATATSLSAPPPPSSRDPLPSTERPT